MPSPRLLVIEGNTPETMAEHVSYGGTPASKGYSDLLRELLPGAAVDICTPADTTALLPKGEALVVPFFCDVFVGESMRWCGEKAKFMEQMTSQMQTLAAEGHFPVWE